jgi:hypothetical protein
MSLEDKMTPKEMQRMAAVRRWLKRLMHPGERRLLLERFEAANADEIKRYEDQCALPAGSIDLALMLDSDEFVRVQREVAKEFERRSQGHEFFKDENVPVEAEMEQLRTVISEIEPFIEAQLNLLERSFPDGVRFMRKYGMRHGDEDFQAFFFVGVTFLVAVVIIWTVATAVTTLGAVVQAVETLAEIHHKAVLYTEVSVGGEP